MELGLYCLKKCLLERRVSTVCANRDALTYRRNRAKPVVCSTTYRWFNTMKAVACAQVDDAVMELCMHELEMIARLASGIRRDSRTRACELESELTASMFAGVRSGGGRSFCADWFLPRNIVARSGRPGQASPAGHVTPPGRAACLPSFTSLSHPSSTAAEPRYAW